MGQQKVTWKHQIELLWGRESSRKTAKEAGLPEATEWLWKIEAKDCKAFDEQGGLRRIWDLCEPDRGWREEREEYSESFFETIDDTYYGRWMR